VARQLDALVIASSGNDTVAFERMDRQGQHYVLIDREFPGLSANSVGIDDEAAGRIATEHLIDPGCKTIGHIKGPHVGTGIRRFEGYQSALLHRGLPYSDHPRLRFREYGSATQVKATFSRRAIPFFAMAVHSDPLRARHARQGICFLQCNPGQLQKCKY
jgi:DNA-binding LacI/PurR family transcriptional regulator